MPKFSPRARVRVRVGNFEEGVRIIHSCRHFFLRFHPQIGGCVLYTLACYIRAKTVGQCEQFGVHWSTCLNSNYRYSPSWGSLVCMPRPTVSSSCSVWVVMLSLSLVSSTLCSVSTSFSRSVRSSRCWDSSFRRPSAYVTGSVNKIAQTWSGML